MNTNAKRENYTVSYLPISTMATNDSFLFIDGKQLVSITKNEISFYEKEKMHISELIEIEVKNCNSPVISLEGRIIKIEEIECNNIYLVMALITEKDSEKLLEFVNFFNVT